MSFSSIGKNVLYLPVFYQNDEYTPAGYPFRLDDSGQLQVFQPDMEKCETLIVSDAGKDHPWLYRMQQGVFEGANRMDFFDKKVLYIIKDMPGSDYEKVGITDLTPYRYLRYVSPKGLLGQFGLEDARRVMNLPKASPHPAKSGHTFPLQSLTKKHARAASSWSKLITTC